MGLSFLDPVDLSLRFVCKVQVLRVGAVLIRGSQRNVAYLDRAPRNTQPLESLFAAKARTRSPGVPGNRGNRPG